MELKNSSQKVILLLFPLIINKFDFQSEGKINFFNMGKTRKKELKEKGIASLAEEKILKLVEVNYNQEVKKVIREDPDSKLILVNYPHNEIGRASCRERV